MQKIKNKCIKMQQERRNDFRVGGNSMADAETITTGDYVRQRVDVTRNCMAGHVITPSMNACSQPTKRAPRLTLTATSSPNDNTESSPDVLPPLRFHSVHGDCLRMSSDGCEAERIQPGCGRGEAFSSRPVRINEMVCLRFVKVSAGISNILYGFSARNPAEINFNDPMWRRNHLVTLLPLAKNFYKKDIIVHYHVNTTGKVCLGVNGEPTRGFVSKVDITTSLWAMVQFNGVGTAIQFVEPDTQIMRTFQMPAEEERTSEMPPHCVEDPLPRSTSQGPLIPLSLHATKGRNIYLCSEIAARKGGRSQGYVFTAHPMLPSQTIVIKISADRRPGGLAYGLTSCDPATLRQCDLPDDTEQLLDRPEYWVVRQYAAAGLRRGDEFAVTLSLNGEVQESKNSSDPITVMHVDHTLKLWAFVDLYETTQRVRMMTTPVESPLQQSGSAVLRPGVDWSTLTRQPRETERLSETVSEADRITVGGRDVGATTSVAGRDVSSTSSDASRARPVTATRARPQQGVQMGTTLENLEQPSTSRQHPDSKPDVVNQSDTECSVCFDRQIDCALYKCGHMCACYACALQLWQDGGGRCPICRAEIREVMRIFKS